MLLLIMRFNLKVKYGTVTELTQDLWTHFIRKSYFKQYNVVELSKCLFRAFINKGNEILPKEKYNKIF